MHADDFCFDGLQSNKVDSGLHHKLKTPILEGAISGRKVWVVFMHAYIDLYNCYQY